MRSYKVEDLQIGDYVQVLLKIESRHRVLFFTNVSEYNEKSWGKIIKKNNDEKKLLIEFEESPVDTNPNWISFSNILEIKFSVE